MFFFAILLQDKYNIDVSTINIKLMWLGTKRMKRLAKAHLPPVYKHSHINVTFTVNIPILYIHMAISDVCFHTLSYLFILFISDFSGW